MHISAWTWAFYIFGQALHIFLDANDSVMSKTDAVATFRTYFRTRLKSIIGSFFLTTCAFPLIWSNPALFDIERFVTNAAMQVGVAGILGWFSDSAFSKVLSFVPWLQKGLPQPPAGG